MPFRNSRFSDLVVIVIFAIILGSSVFFFRQARHWIGAPFPSFLALENNVVGAFDQFEWAGTKAGLRYHDLVKPDLLPGQYTVVREGLVFHVEIPPAIFSVGDFLRVFCLPFFSGFLFLILAGLIYWFMRGSSGAFPFFLFNAGVSYYLMSSFDFHSSHHASSFFLLIFGLLPAFMTHFALVYPEPTQMVIRRWQIVLLPYAISLLLFIPYVVSFYDYPGSWPLWEGVVISYQAFSYFFWIARLAQIAQNPHHEFARTTAKYLLVGQLMAFMLPLVLIVYIFIFKGHTPLNYAATVTVILPISSLFGLMLGKLKQTQMELVQREKMASLGQLLAGVAHEINNPTTFIYSNIAPLKEYLSYLKKLIPPGAPLFKGEMSSQEVLEDFEKLAGNIEEGAVRTRQIISDLRGFGHTQEDDVSEVKIKDGIVSTLNILKHSWEGRVKVEVDCPDDLVINANKGQISQVWMNLLSNSIQSISGEGMIQVIGKQDERGITVSISDSGCGMKKNILAKIFDPFFTTKGQGEGTGLGLSIVQQIVKRWAGKIEVHSEPDKGTEFVVTFPPMRYGQA
jgi:signal transduction histidine kinase